MFGRRVRARSTSFKAWISLYRIAAFPVLRDLVPVLAVALGCVACASGQANDASGGFQMDGTDAQGMTSGDDASSASDSTYSPTPDSPSAGDETGNATGSGDDSGDDSADDGSALDAGGNDSGEAGGATCSGGTFPLRRHVCRPHQQRRPLLGLRDRLQRGDAGLRGLHVRVGLPGGDARALQRHVRQHNDQRLQLLDLRPCVHHLRGQRDTRVRGRRLHLRMQQRLHRLQRRMRRHSDRLP